MKTIINRILFGLTCVAIVLSIGFNANVKFENLIHSGSIIEHSEFDSKLSFEAAKENFPISDSEPIEIEDEDKEEEGKKESEFSKLVFHLNSFDFSVFRVLDGSREQVCSLQKLSTLPLYIKYKNLLI